MNLEFQKPVSCAYLRHQNFWLCTHSAQCSPRHACPLKRSLLMQVHEPAQAAPVLAWWGK
ncbi:hypothetical protein C9546_20690 [Salmonella enterica]|uniref:Uncharacterized protein n=1 Tax=Salmonella enterica TaxID=28901 RepID=A0A5U5E235_SALER|nr:hypothetical protein [Salmonella enterica]ECT8241382.1 hypothetical protein [Salmonella enterica subsp. enterica serovar Typhimurium]EAB4793361.1 hypothetical protein [Salmonella enterica]EAM8589165.1 hypothetical protein [Salmonella enterica]EAO0053870.1 hypothetical protein [Salmonella enterica]